MADSEQRDAKPTAAGEDEERPRIKVVDRRWWKQADESDSADASGAEWQPGKPTYLQELEQQIADKDAQIQEFVGKYRDASKEFDEARARLRRETAREIERGRRAVLVELLDVVDNLDRAIEAAGSATSVEALKHGVELVRRQFLGKLEGFGVTRIDAEGTPFDPAVHEAVSTITTEDPEQDGRVAGVVNPGYRIGEDILRPAVVAVAKVQTADAAGPES